MEPEDAPDVFIILSKLIYDYFDNNYWKSGQGKYWGFRLKAPDSDHYKSRWSLLRTRLEEKAKKAESIS